MGVQVYDLSILEILQSCVKFKQAQLLDSIFKAVFSLPLSPIKIVHVKAVLGQCTALYTLLTLKYKEKNINSYTEVPLAHLHSITTRTGTFVSE